MPTLVAHVEDPNSSLPERARVILRLLIDTVFGKVPTQRIDALRALAHQKITRP
jgi:hypothetical protein